MASTTAEPVSIFKKRSSKAKAALRKRPANPPPEASDSADDCLSSDDGQGQRIKRRKHNGATTISSSTTTAKPTADNLNASQFEADRSATIQITSDATKQSNWYDENSTDALSSKSLLGTTRALPAAGAPPQSDGTYKGNANYQSYVQKNPDAPSRSVGPIKAPTNIRTITVTDFAPDVCKDYKQTGFCGFGDSCKFLHAREDYKQGWQLDKDWEIGTKGKKVGGKTIASADRSAQTEGDADPDDALLEKIPFACVICKKPYTNPIVTKCSHYFCEACALKTYRKSPNCAACGSGTGGVFNGAKNLKRLLEKKKEREQAKKEKEEAEAEGKGDGN